MNNYWTLSLYMKHTIENTNFLQLDSLAKTSKSVTSLAQPCSLATLYPTAVEKLAW
jgi:hypothetical protein